MLLKKAATIALFSCAITSQAWSFSPACDPELFKTEILDDQYGAINLSYLKLIKTEEDFRKAKNSSLTASLKVDGVPVSLVNDYSDFNERKRRNLNLTNFTFSEEGSRQFAASFIGAEGLQAYVACLKAHRNNGLAVWIDSTASTQDTISLGVSWDAPPGASTDPGDYDVILESPDSSPPIEQTLNIARGGNTSVSIGRRADIDFIATVHFLLNDQHLASQPIIVKRVPTTRTVQKLIDLPRNERVFATADGISRAAYDDDWCVEPFPGGWQIVTETLELDSQLSRTIGEGGISTNHDPRTWRFTDTKGPNKACVRVGLSRYEGDADTITYSITGKQKKDYLVFD